MKAEKIKNNISIELSKEEAIVFLNWLFTFNEKKHPDLFQDQSEERVLWDIEATLEKAVDETFSNNYNNILSEARKKVRD